MVSKSAGTSTSSNVAKDKPVKRPRPDLSLFNIFCGSRGSGKTLSAVAYLSLLMIAGYRAWSNIPVRFTLVGKDDTERHLSAEPLNIDALMTFDDELVEGIILIDELPLFGSDNRMSLSVRNKLMNSSYTLLRKHRLSILATSQSFSWLDKRTQFQTDALCICRDLRYFSNRNMEPGEYISQSWRDLSGIMTGRTFQESGKEYGQVLWGRPFWNCYDSWAAFDILASMQPAKLKLGTKEITRVDLVGGQGRMKEDVEAYLMELRKLGHQSVTAKEAFAYFEGKDPKVIGRFLRGFGCRYRQTRKGAFYDLPEV